MIDAMRIRTLFAIRKKTFFKKVDLSVFWVIRVIDDNGISETLSAHNSW